MQHWLVASLVLASMALARAAGADGPPRAPDLHDKAAAAAMGEQALSLFEAGKWREAYGAFLRADTLYHAPTLVLYMAHCQKMLGRNAAARRLYRRVAAEPLPPGVPHQFLTAQSVAREEADRLKESVARIKIVLRGVEPERVLVTVDGDVFSLSEPAPHELDPGEHVIEATPPGTPPERRTVTLKLGTSTEVLFTFPERPAETPPAPVAEPSKGDAPAEKPRSEEVDLWAPGVISLGAGAAGIGIGAITGVMSLSSLDDVRSRCRPDGHCLAADEARARSAARLGDASTAAFVLGSVAAAAGGLMLFLHHRSTPSAARSSALCVDVGPAYAGLRGSF